MTIKPPPGMAECPQCNPCSPELDEDGRPYTCYCCGDTGWISVEALAELRASEAPATAIEPNRTFERVTPSWCDWTDIPF